MRMAVLFDYYVLVYDVKGAVQIVWMDQLDGYLAYLNAFCTTAEWTPICEPAHGALQGRQGGKIP